MPLSVSRKLIPPTDLAPHNEWRYYWRSGDAWEAMLADCEKAEKSIAFEQYIFEKSGIGERFLRLFIQKAREGVSIYLLADMFGSMGLRSSPLIKELKRSGACVRFFNKLSFLDYVKPWRWFPRTHTKTLLIDSRIAYTGGVCVADHMQPWRDTHIRFTGPAVTQVRQAFDYIKSRRQRKKKQALKPPHLNQKDRFQYIINDPMQGRLDVYRTITDRISSAKRCIYISSGYFMPNKRFIQLLQAAALRGVDVRVLVSRRSDTAPADWAFLSYWRCLFESGVRLYLYRENILHCKTAVIDDAWGTVGSTNFDVISFFRNREANLVFDEESCVRELKDQYFIDLQKSDELNETRWAEMALWRKLLGFTTAQILRLFY